MPELPQPEDGNMAQTVEVLNDLLAKIDTLTTKMNSDAGISDTDYETDFESSLGLDATDGEAI